MTPDQVQWMMLFVADPVYFAALDRGASGAEALREVVAAVMERCEALDALPSHTPGDPLIISREPGSL